GGFGLADNNNKQLFLGSGVGVTPLVSMYREAANKQLAATFIQVTSNDNNVAFEQELNDINNSVAQGEFKTHFRDVDGFIDSKQLQEYVDANTEIYICGGNSFLNSMIMQ